jgi:hypothetical protein
LSGDGCQSSFEGEEIAVNVGNECQNHAYIVMEMRDWVNRLFGRRVRGYRPP